jgi:hypothetical protein
MPFEFTDRKDWYGWNKNQHGPFGTIPCSLKMAELLMM